MQSLLPYFLAFFQQSPGPQSLCRRLICPIRPLLQPAFAHRFFASRFVVNRFFANSPAASFRVRASASLTLICAPLLLLSGCGASLTVAKDSGALVADPGSITFGSLPVGSSAKANVTLVNESFNAVEIEGVSFSNKSFSLLNSVNAPMRIAAGGSLHLAVTFTPTQAGTATGDLTVSTTAAPSGSAVVHLSGLATKTTTVAPSSATLTVNATSASFGDVELNTIATQSLTLTSTGGASVNISSSSVTGAAFSSSGFIAPATLPPGQSVTIHVQFNPTAPGSATGALVIKSNSSTNSTLSLPLSGNGVAQIVQLAQVVQLSWQPPATSDTTIAGYRIYRAIDGVAQFQLLNTSLTGNTDFADGTVQTGQTYNYYVTSVDTAGEESTPSNTATVVIPRT